MNKEEFIKSLNDMDISLTKKQLEQFDTYYKRLIEYNSHTNLTRITIEEEVYLEHFYDSLTFIKTIKLDDQKLLDVGTGAGFPGLVLKIAFPSLKVTLVDSLNKRINFLNSLIEELELTDVVAIHARAEDFAKENRDAFDIVTSRAVANLSMLSELCLPLVKKGGYFIPMKAEAKDEIENAENAIKTLGGVIEKIVNFSLIKDSGKRTLIKIKKIAKTNVKYPRKFSEIKKKPL